MGKFIVIGIFIVILFVIYCAKEVAINSQYKELDEIKLKSLQKLQDVFTNYIQEFSDADKVAIITLFADILS